MSGCTGITGIRPQSAQACGAKGTQISSDIARALTKEFGAQAITSTGDRRIRILHQAFCGGSNPGATHQFSDMFRGAKDPPAESVIGLLGSKWQADPKNPKAFELKNGDLSSSQRIVLEPKLLTLESTKIDDGFHNEVVRMRPDGSCERAQPMPQF